MNDHAVCGCPLCERDRELTRMLCALFNLFQLAKDGGMFISADYARGIAEQIGALVIEDVPLDRRLDWRPDGQQRA